MQSPVAALRGDTLQRTFAHQLGISRMALLRLEQGLLPEPSLKLRTYFANDDAWLDFLDDYDAYQTAKREANYGVLTTEPDFNAPIEDFQAYSDHPFSLWMEQSNAANVTQVCVALCLHLPIMHRFLNGPYPAQCPDLLLTALDESGYDPDLISDFVMEYAHWYSRSSK